MRTILVVVAALLVASPSWAACIKEERAGHFENGMLWTYAASDQPQTALTVSFEGQTLKAVMFEPKSKKNLRLIGNIIDDGRFNISTAKGTAPSVIIEGEFVPTDPRGKFKSRLECEVFTSRVTLGSQQFSLIFGMESGTAGTLGHRYAAIGADDDDLVERGAMTFVGAVSTGDKQLVSTLIDYPVQVAGTHGDEKIATPAEMIEKYDRIFRPEFIKAVSRSRPYHMFVRNGVAYLDTGLAFFDANGKVTEIGNWDK